MAKLTTADIANLQNETTAVSTINSNFAATEAAMDNSLSRDGSSPNAMNADLDMNSHKILNLPAATSANEPVRKTEFDAAQLGNLVASSTGIVVANTSSSILTRTLTGTSNEVTITNGTGVSGNPTISLPTALTFTGKTVTGGTFSGGTISGVTLGADINLPGNPTTTTQTVGNNTTRVATTAFVAGAVAAATAGVASLNGQTGNLFLGMYPGGRLTLTTAVPVTESDVAGAGTVYLAMSDYDTTMIYDGTNWVPRVYSGELPLALDSNAGHTNYHQSGKNFDLYEFWDGAAVDTGTGPAWTSNTGRGTGAGTTELEVFQGRLVNKNTITLRFGTASGNTTSINARRALYRGTFRTTADGTTEDSLIKRFLFDVYRAVERPLRKVDTTNSWSYTTAAFRQANGAATNQVEWLQGLTGRPIKLHASGSWFSATTGGVATGIGIDGILDNSHTRLDNAVTSSNLNAHTHAWYDGYPGLGYHYGTWLEYGATGATAYGDNNDVTKQTGIKGYTWQ